MATTNQPDGYAEIVAILRDFGLESLAPKVQSWLVQGLSEDEILFELRETPEFRQRFPAIFARQEAGLAPISPAEYVAYERQARQLMFQAGLPQGFFDDPSDFTDFLTKDLSLAELSSRIERGYQRVAQADPLVRQAFEAYFGVQGDQALAAYYLDPERALPVLERMTETAVVGGTGQRFGVGVGQQMAERVAAIGGAERAEQIFTELGQTAAVFRETVDEDTDLDIGVEGVEAGFGLNATSGEKIRRRRQAREAAFGGAGEAGASGEGILGLGQGGRQR